MGSKRSEARAIDMSHTPGGITASDASDRRNAPTGANELCTPFLARSVNPSRRRRVHRALSLRDIDWHQPQWLASRDANRRAVLRRRCVTLSLMSHGAMTVNPIMAPIVGGFRLVSPPLIKADERGRRGAKTMAAG